jgi:hypothetical protein
MAVEPSDGQVPPQSPTQDTPVVTEVRERIETARLVGRQRRTWRTMLIVLASMALLLAAVVVRRDQVRRESSLKDLRVLAVAMDRWVHAQMSLPPDLQAIAGDKLPDVDGEFEYTDINRRILAIQRGQIVALVFARRPVKLILGQSGRGVLLCRQADFDVKWMSEAEFAAQRSAEKALMARFNESLRVSGKP